MFNVQVEGFHTQAQAKAFIDWYCGQGEQDASIWFEYRQDEGEIDVKYMNTDCKKTYPIVFKEDTAKLVLDIKDNNKKE